MVTIKDKLFFNYDGVSSEDFGLTVVNMESGMYEEVLTTDRTIEETKPSGRDTSIFHKISKKNRSFSLSLAFDKGFNEERLLMITDWLVSDYYKPLYFESIRNRVVFAMVTGEIKIVHNGFNEGYLLVDMKTNSPYVYSNEIIGYGEGGSIMMMSNMGHKKTYPSFKIEKIGDGDLKIRVDDYNILISNLVNGEILKIDSLREIIETDLVGKYRYNNITIGELSDLALERGSHEYEIIGGAKIEYRYREIFKF